MRKKFTMLFTVLLACVGVMKAEVNSELISQKMTVGSDATAVAENQWYVLYCHGRNACVSEETTAFKMRTKPANDELAENHAGKLFKFTAVEGQEGQYYIVSGNGLYFDFVENNSSAVSETPVAYKVAQIGDNAGHFYIQKVENSFVADGQENGNSFVCWEKNVPTAAGGNNCYHLLPVTLTKVSTVDVTFNYYVEDVLKHTVTVAKQVVGSNVAAPTFGFVTFEAPTGQVSETNKVFNIKCTLEAAPLTFSTVENPVWQVVEMHRYGSYRVWDYVGNDKAVSVTEMGADKMGVVEDSKLWCFVGDHFGFKIYNKKAGFNVTLNATNGNPKVGTPVDGNDEWFFTKSSATEAANACCFKNENTPYMNRSAQGVIGYYGNNDNGSTCYFEAPSVSFLPAAKAFKEVLENYEIPADAPENAIGYLTATEEQINAFVEGVDANSETIEAMQALYASAKAIMNSVSTPTAGYYFIKATGTGNDAKWYATYGANNSDFMAMSLAEGEKLGAKHVWKFDEITGEGGFKFKSCNLGKYAQLAVAPTTSQISADYNNGYKFVPSCPNFDGKFIIKDGNGNVMRTEGGGQINSWNGETNESWYLIPVTELELTINEFASVCLPFDVTLGEGVKAYAITAADATKATLTEKGDIPAGQAAILEGKGTVTLNLAQATSNWDDNMLKGTTVNTYVEGVSYVLSCLNDVHGLYKAKLNKNAEGAEGNTHFLNNANKAYLPAPAGAKVPMLSFGRGEGTTAIDNAQLTNDNVEVVIYDLLGRRVEKMEKGIYIVNGRKVLVK